MKKILSILLVLTCLLTCLPLTASASTGGKLIALTFDDGPSAYTNTLLDGLVARGVKVTFFMLGQCAKYYPNTVRRVYDEGHQIAQHTYDHPALTTLSDEKIRWQIETTDAILDDILGQDLDYLIRTPYGDCSSRVLGLLGTPSIVWSVDSCDWQLLNAQKVCDQIVRNAFDGAIVLVHDIHKTSIPGALAAIDILLAQGYEFVTVSELFRRRGVSLDAGTNYYSCKPNGTDLGALKEPNLTVQNGKLIFENIPAGATVRYTTDGSVPNHSSRAFLLPIELYEGTFRYYVETDGARTPRRSITISGRGNLFRDVLMTDWFYLAADRAVSLDLFRGTGNYAFEPQTGLTRAMFVTVLHRLMTQKGETTGTTAEADFPDLTQDWYLDAVSWAYGEGIVSGYEDGTFRPDRQITRKEMCVILNRTLAWLEQSAEPTTLTFTDTEEISDWALEAVMAVCSFGLIEGHPDGAFRPQDTATRAQAAVVLLRLYDLIPTNR